MNLSRTTMQSAEWEQKGPILSRNTGQSSLRSKTALFPPELPSKAPGGSKKG